MSFKWKQYLHMEPVRGWMNDPNGLVFHNGLYHVYFQYTPGNATGEGLRSWGHFVSPDLLKWRFVGEFIKPDHISDSTGAFSGSAVSYKDKIYYFYTGNVEHEGFDLVLEGREANQIFVTSDDGTCPSDKTALLTNSDYPDYCSCHVRDPKVSFADGIWRMVLGARTKDDEGMALVYEGPDPCNFRFKEAITCPGMGYMWECPDLVDLGGRSYLLACVQGMEAEEYKYQNQNSSGYFRLVGNKASSYEELDSGFDFYAPQTFAAPDGRRILIGWMGQGTTEYTNPTIEMGRQHCLSIPREIETDAEGFILQNPIREIDSLRCSLKAIEGESWHRLPLDIVCRADAKEGYISISGVKISFDGDVLKMEFADPTEGFGRIYRKIKTGIVKDIRIIADRSSLEVFINSGRYVLSTRFYPAFPEVRIETSGLEADAYRLMNKDTLVAIGEALIDFIPDRSGVSFGEVRSFSPRTGGAPANVCGAFSVLGGSSRIITGLGADPFGRLITDDLIKAGVDTSAIEYTDKANTALAFVTLGRYGEREFSFYRKPSADMLYGAENIRREFFDDCWALHFCSVSLGDFPMRDAHRVAIALARKEGALISFDPNLRFMLWDDLDKLKAAVACFIPEADILKISDDELEFITGTSDLDEALGVLFTGNVKLVIYTMGSKGCYAIDKDGNKIYVPSVKTQAVDTTGAGDGFIGSLLYYLKSKGIKRDDLEYISEDILEEALVFASRFSSISIRTEGAIQSYPTMEQINKEFTT